MVVDMNSFDTIFLNVNKVLSTQNHQLSTQVESFVHKLSQKHSVYLISDKDYTSVLTIVPKRTRELFEGIFSDSGGQLYKEDLLVSANGEVHEFPSSMIDSINEFIGHIGFYDVYDRHLYISNVRRNPDSGLVKVEELLDKPITIRENFVKSMNIKYPEYDFVLDGSIGILVYRKGCGKERILDRFDSRKISYFCCNSLPLHSDYKISMGIERWGGCVKSISNPKHFIRNIKGGCCG
jgi:hypothetical protein